MRQFSETIFSKSIIVRTKEIYPLSLDILDNMDAFGAIKEKQHAFDTDGPRSRVHLFFDVEDVIDDRSSIVFSFRINGDGNNNGEGVLDIDIVGSFFVNIPYSDKLGPIVFNSFYIKTMFPMLRKGMEKKINVMGDFIEKKVKTLNFKYT